MKLTKSQIIALSNKLYKELNDVSILKKKKENDIILKSFYKTKDGKIIKYLNEKYPNIITNYIIEQLSGINNTKRVLINYTLISDEIILESINSSEINVLIKSIKDKYLKLI